MIRLRDEGSAFARDYENVIRLRDCAPTARPSLDHETMIRLGAYVRNTLSEDTQT